MFSFLKKKINLPEFNFIKSYSEKDKYFVRVKKWNWINTNEICLFEKDFNGNIKTITLDYWFQEMFLDADGQKTISEYLYILVKQFRNSKMEIPKDLDKFMIETLVSLKTDLNAIEFCETPTEIKIEYKNPIKE
ncbi:hypothetical protein [Flavobacterium oreochromis]|uniref:Uncharacterized protein n=2 Tax=Flavobacterium TaxID=237 RepID=A0A246G977_9FLAO|nr:hypothetical protein [Flavobacterium oreochromis]OWP75947.1 hypothetical protein BWK62_10840 [Flavobacterium oreochromis]OWP77870.1 hypothetical protein BWG23_03590 [Flavobacterium oreochromis]